MYKKVKKNSKKGDNIYKLIRITTVPISLKILLKGQLKHMSQYFDVLAVSSSGKELDEVSQEQGVKTKAIEMSRKITPFRDLMSLVRMVLLFIKEKPDIVHTHTPKAGLIGMLAAWIIRVPHRLHTVAGLPLMESKGIKRKVLLAVEKLTYVCATHIYPNSKGLEKFITENTLTKKSKLKVIGNGSSNGIDSEHFRETNKIKSDAQSLRDQYNITSGDFIFIFVGRIVADKGISELLSAFDKLSKEYRDTKLLLVGPFEESLDPIDDKTKNILSTNKNIFHVGFQEDVRSFFALSNALVFPSYREGFPNVVMQAGAMELPAIVSDINGCNEIIQDKKNGVIVPPKDTTSLYKAMNMFAEDRGYAHSLANNARDMIVSRYDQQFVWKEIKDEYDLLLGKQHD